MFRVKSLGLAFISGVILRFMGLGIMALGFVALGFIALGFRATGFLLFPHPAPVSAVGRWRFTVSQGSMLGSSENGIHDRQK